MSTKDACEIKAVPATPGAREGVWIESLRAMDGVPRGRPLGREDLTDRARRVLETVGLADSHLGYAMVMVNNAFWLEQFLAVPIERRLLLLPRCLVDLDVVEKRASELGYRTYVAEGSPVVVKILAAEDMDAILGVGCLDSLEKAFARVNRVGIPAVAVPLDFDGCKSTEVNTRFVLWLMESTGPAAEANTRSYLPLLRAAQGLFSEGRLEELLGPLVAGEDRTARIALDWVRRGGKRLRPFLTLAAYRAVAGGTELPEPLLRTAAAIELFHKASLIHDDLEDADELRYGRKTVHAAHGDAAAINVGDYLVGLGYSLALSAAAGSGRPEAAAVGKLLSGAHVRLTLGQGAELLWSPETGELKLADALRWYMLKTSPAFEAALACGMAMAGDYEKHAQAVKVFCRHLGTAFQVQNDLAGWKADAARACPTVLLALALERCGGEGKRRLLRPAGAEETARIYEECGVVARARDLVDTLRRHALETADGDLPEDLAELMRLLVDIVTRWT
ncbi:MAG: polyprenyl synthetase family protein [Planctomycetota bacterium]|jgi:geranylgeranyl pyrophosphate synthase